MTADGTQRFRPDGAVIKMVKCVVWDLDNTLWDGVLLEGDGVSPRPGVVDVIKELDNRGIVNSIASRNESELAEAKLKELGLEEYFVYPQINWNAKSASIRAIATALNIGIDGIAFIDDDQYERDEVAFSLPEVLCIDAGDIVTMLSRSELTPRMVTRDSKRRRLMYRAEQVRKAAEEQFGGPREEFLVSLEMRLRIAPAREHDLKRAEELTLRTNQLNATGYTYSYDELEAFRSSDRHALLIAELEDRYGPYGNIGLILVEQDGLQWTIKLLLMSCRVMARGLGAVMLNHVKRLAKEAGARLLAEFVSTGRNRMMYTTYRLSRFKEISRREDMIMLEGDLGCIPPFPPYVHVTSEKV